MPTSDSSPEGQPIGIARATACEKFAGQIGTGLCAGRREREKEIDGQREEKRGRERHREKEGEREAERERERERNIDRERESMSDKGLERA